MSKLIEEIRKKDTASISDAMDKLGIPCGLLGIQAVIPGRKICGEAFTVHYVPCGMEKGTVGDFLDDVQPGQVVVIDNAGRDWCTVWGDIMTYTAKAKGVEGTLIDGVCRDVNGIEELGYGIYTKGRYMVTGKERVQVDQVNVPVATACKVRGIAGVIIDGSCRDAQDIVALGLPVFVRGLNPSGTVKESLAKLNVPVRCGGVEVHPGDIVLGDCDGVVVVPKADEDAVFEKAIAKFEKEQHIVDQLLAGKTTLEVYGFDRLIERKQAQ